MIYLKAKNAGDTVDYQVDFVDLIPPEFNLDSATVEITKAGNTESPIELLVEDTAIVVDESPAERATAVLFWLVGGTVDVNYELRITASDSQSVVPDRVYTRYARIQVRDDL